VRNWTVPAGVTSVKVLVVAGGGGGGSSNSIRTGGAGGGGGVAVAPNYAVTPGANVVVITGAGGFGANCGNGNKGGNSTFGSIGTYGGGGGSGCVAAEGIGGSGGGGHFRAGGRSNIYSVPAGVTGYGNAGGAAGTDYNTGGGGGGGGATQAGSPGTGAGADGTGGNGGEGIVNSFRTDSPIVYGSGGGGQGYSIQGVGGTNAGKGCGTDASGSGGAHGTNETGGGGGGGWMNCTQGQSAGRGGSGIVVVRYVPTLAQPTNVVAVPTPNWGKSVDVSWDPVPNAQSYKVYLMGGSCLTAYGTKSGIVGTSTTVTRFNMNAFTMNGASYKVAVQAIGDGVSYLSSSYTQCVEVFPNQSVAIPTISSQPVSSSRTEGQSVSLSVSASTTDAGVLSYQWSKDGVAISGATSSTYDINSVVTNQAGSYTVDVINTLAGISISTASNAATLTVAGALSIATPVAGLGGTAHSAFSLAVPASGGLSNLTYALTGTLVSGLLFSTSTGTISGTPTAIGNSALSVTVTDANGATASTDTFTVTIGYASTTLSISLADSSPRYGTIDRITASTSRAGNVAFRVDGLLIPGCESVATSSSVATCDWVPLAPGAVSVAATFSPSTPTYSASTSSLSPTVAARAITVTPTSNQSKVFGTVEPSFTYSITSGSLYGSDSLSGSLTRASGENAGTYAITGGTLSNPKYSITLTPVMFTITQATQSAVTLTSTSGTFGTPITLTASGGSGSGGYSFSVTNAGSAGCSISGGTLSSSTPGSCTVTVTRAASTNYLSSSSPATTVTINKLSQVALSIAATSGDLYTGIIVSVLGGSGSGSVTSSVTSGTANCSLASGVVSARVVGTCVLTVTKAEDVSYQSISASFTLTFSKAVPVQGTLNSTKSGTVGTGITLNFSGGSGSGRVSYSLSAPGGAGCSIKNGVLTATTAGKCTVTITREADDTYAAQTSTAEFTFVAGTVSSTTPKRTVVTTTVPPTTTTTTTAPQAPSLVNTKSATGAATIAGKTEKATTTRVNNQLVMTAGGFTVTLAGVDSDGNIIPLTEDGLLEVRRGDLLRLDARGFSPGSKVDIWMFSKPILMAQIEVGENGLVRTTLKVPKSAENGLHHLVMVGIDKAEKEAKFEVGMNIGVPQKQWWYSRILLVIPITIAVFFGLWLPTSASRRRRLRRG
jgi:hypothetical protein